MTEEEKECMFELLAHYLVDLSSEGCSFYELDKLRRYFRLIDENEFSHFYPEPYKTYIFYQKILCEEEEHTEEEEVDPEEETVPASLLVVEDVISQVKEI